MLCLEYKLLCLTAIGTLTTHQNNTAMHHSLSFEAKESFDSHVHHEMYHMHVLFSDLNKEKFNTF